MAVVTLDGRLMTLGSNDHSKLGLKPTEKEKFVSKSWRYNTNSGERMHAKQA